MKSAKIIKFLFVIVGLLLLGQTAYEFLFNGITAGAIGTLGGSLANFSMTGIPNADLKKIGLVDGTEDMGGFGCTAYLAFRQHITGYPTLPSETPTSLEELCVLLGNYSLATGKNFMEVTVPPETMQINPESQGEHVGAKSFKSKGEIFIPGFSKVSAAIARLLNNSYGVLIIPQEDGTRIALGSELHPLKFIPKGKSGVKTLDAKGFTFEFEFDSFLPIAYYEGEIVLDGSTLPAVS